MAGIRRAKGTAPWTKTPALTDDIRAMIAATPDNSLGMRDRALLLLGFAGAFRRSELVGLDVSAVEFTRDGLIVMLRRSKTDQDGAGRKVAIPYGSHTETCPVRALQLWIETVQIEYGPVFRHVDRHGHIHHARLSGYAVALVVKRYAEAAGLDPAKYAGHSLRAGLATSAAIAGASERSIMQQTGHRSTAMATSLRRPRRRSACASIGGFFRHKTETYSVGQIVSVKKRNTWVFPVIVFGALAGVLIGVGGVCREWCLYEVT